MIGAGIFVLTGKIAELVGSLFPIVFIVGAVVVGFRTNIDIIKLDKLAYLTLAMLSGHNNLSINDSK